MPTQFIDIARSLCRVPTAPFHEHFALDHVRSFCAKRPKVKLSSDPHGNLFLLYDGGNQKQGDRLVMTAHLDHPGLIWQETLAPGRSLFQILGGVDLSQALKSDVKIYDLHRPATQRGWRGKIIDTTPVKGARYPLLEIESTSNCSGGPGTFAMWDVPPFTLRGNRLSGRALDDLAGASVGLSVLDQLHQQRSSARASLLLTRAEEVGFVGMLAAIENKFTRRRAFYINIECSSVKAGATQGAGPIVRVGDRISIFDPQISGGLTALADDLREADANFNYQRKLMDSGACEATALMQAGYRSGAVALPLGNYHNASPGKKLAAENIDLRDAQRLVQLLTHLAQQGIGPATEQSGSKLDAMLTSRLQKYRTKLDHP